MKYVTGFLILILIIAAAFYLFQPSDELIVPVEQEDTRDIVWTNADLDDIVVQRPQSRERVGATFPLSGMAKGTWYFEASFPIEVLDANGRQLYVGPVQAQGEWMTEDFVPFSTSVTVPSSYHGRATLVLRNDNPSGLPENEKGVAIPITIE